MKYNRPHGTASWGTQAKDWERGIDYDRLRKQRLARAQQAIKSAGLGAVVCFTIHRLNAARLAERPWLREGGEPVAAA